VSGSYSPSVTSNDRFGSPCGSVRRPGMSACARAIAKPRLGCGRPPVVVLHNVKQPASRHLPRNTSRSRAASLRRGVIVSLCLHRISAAFADHSAGLRPNLGRHQLRRRNEGAGGAPGGVTAVVALVRSRHSRLRGVLVPRNRDARLSALHRGAAGPGPLSRSGIAAASGAMGCSRQALSCLTAEPGFSYPRVTSRGRRHSPLRLLDRLRKTPLMSEDGESSIIYSLRSQQLNSYRSRSGVRARAFSCPRQGVAHYADQAAGNVPDHAARI
jgi:hypothetical protein